ncbi:RES family NAD+ phosphorylase [Achromobacter seleniivolatilans]|uniref:RES family NAD+ phosphorylase n=1 Tax=Achromobacter seleniivolatilans TaxID=3047478 RepID=A0ABY9M4R3_9BURK|nr:RES family NAD+ phosphorylase [Achromobacter sp. R39]WMD21986.1 RES family NAD+ phosphorylase [Achromobacter sp. R39]
MTDLVSLWRIGTTAGTYRADDLSGAGAAAVGGRYNSPGTAVVYSSSSVALAVLETVVHFAVRASEQANRYLIELAVPRAVHDARQVLTLGQLEQDYPFWEAVPFAEASQAVGDNWVASGVSALLELPSAIVPHTGVPDCNVLINPAHPDAAHIVVVRRERFIYDPRLS